MNGKVTAVKFAGVESLIEVVNIGGFATSLFALLAAVLPIAWTLIHCMVARSIIFIQDKNCSAFTVMKSVSFETAIGTFVLIIRFFLPLVDKFFFVYVTILLPLQPFLQIFSSSWFFCADFEVLWVYRSSIGVLLWLVYLFIPVLAQGFNSFSLFHQTSYLMKRGKIS